MKAHANRNTFGGQVRIVVDGLLSADGGGNCVGSTGEDDKERITFGLEFGSVVRCDRFLTGAYQRGDEIWPTLDLFSFIESNLFLQAAAEA